MFGNKNFSQIKTALIKAGKIESDATDAEVSQATIDMIAQSSNTEGDAPDPKVEKKEEQSEAKTEDKKEEAKTDDVQAQISLLTKGLQAVTENMSLLTQSVQLIAKGGKQSAVQGEKGTPETPKQEKERAYMKSDINKGVQFKSKSKTGKIVLVTDDEDEA